MEKLQALGREIRYVEYKLRRQKQEKKKMKQMQKDFMHGTNTSELNNGGGIVTKTEEVNFDEFPESSLTRQQPNNELDGARPSNEEEEKLQLELALAMSREVSEKVEPAPTVNRLLVTPPKPTATQPTFDPWGSSGASGQASTSWEPFNAPPAKQQKPVATTDPWGAPPALRTPVVIPKEVSAPPPASAWTAFDDSFGATPTAATTNHALPPVAQPSSVAPPSSDSLFDLPTDYSHPLTHGAPADLLSASQTNDDLLSGEVRSFTSTAQTNQPDKIRKTPTDFLGVGANLVNFDNLVSRPSGVGAVNPFMSCGMGQKPNPFQAKAPGLSINAIANKQNQGFASLDSSGMTPLKPMNNNTVMQPTVPSGSTHQPVFSSTASNTIFGVKPMSLQHNKGQSNPFNL